MAMVQASEISIWTVCAWVVIDMSYSEKFYKRARVLWVCCRSSRNDSFTWITKEPAHVAVTLLVGGHRGGGAEDARTSSDGVNTSTIGSNVGSLDRSMAISAARRPRSTGCRSTVVRSTPGSLLADVLS